MRKKNKQIKKRILSFGLLIITVCTIIFFSINFIKNTFLDFLNLSIKAAGFVVKNINISGISKKKLVILNNELGINKKDSIFKLSTNEIYQNIICHNFVKSAIVKKNLPNTINIKITEKKPIAIFQNNGKFFLIDAGGSYIEEILFKSYNLPIVVGNEANLQAKNIIDKISKFKTIFTKLESMIFVRKRRWDIIISEGIYVKLPETNTEEALEILENLLTKESIKASKSIDLRIKGNIILKNIHKYNRSL